MARINTSLSGGQVDASPTADASPKTAPIGKRARKANTNTDTDAGRPSKRVRKSTDAEAEPRRSRRERNSDNGNNWWEAAGTSTQPDQQSPAGAKSATAKPTKAKKTTKAAKPSAVSKPEADAPKRKAGRPRKSDGASTEVAADAPAENSKAAAGVKGRKQAKPKKAAEARSSKPAAAPAETTNASPQLKGKHRRRNKQPVEEKAQAEEGEKDTESQAKEETEPEAEAEAEDAGRRRRQSAGSGGQPSQNFCQLVPHTRLIPMATMTRKWAPLERDAIAAVQALLEECARTVLSRVRASGAGAGGGGAANERRQEQTRQAISSVTRRLRSKLVKGIPFPPGTVHISSRRGRRGAKGQNGSSIPSGLEADFNFERAVEGAQALEQQLNPLQHAIALLERERKREEEALEADYATLRELETNAQAELRTWRERARKAHVLAPVDGGNGRNTSTSGSGSSLLQVELVEQAPASGEDNDNDENGQNGGLFDNLDKDLSAVAAQLSSHMDSLKGNLQQIDGVVPAMIQSKAALQQVLHQRLEPQQYERILLGL